MAIPNPLAWLLPGRDRELAAQLRAERGSMGRPARTVREAANAGEDFRLGRRGRRR